MRCRGSAVRYAGRGGRRQRAGAHHRRGGVRQQLAAARAAVQTAVDEFATLDVVVNNAGYANSAPIEEISDEDFRAQIETNLFGVVKVTKAALPVLRNQRSGHFIQFSSIGGRVGGSPGMGAYQTAKFAVEGFSEVLNAEVKPSGIKVTRSVVAAEP